MNRTTRHAYGFCLTLCVAALILLTASCLYEYPEMTDEGTLGVNPSTVDVTVNLNLDLTLPEYSVSKAEDISGLDYCHRFIVEVYRNREVVDRLTYYEEITGEIEFTYPVTLSLPTRTYQLLVWSDYVDADSREDLYYNTESMTPLVETDPHCANTEFKDAFYALEDLDISAYEGIQDVSITSEIDLVRPVARYALVSDDVEDFLSYISSGVISGSEFIVQVTYQNYQPIGYNLLDSVAKNSLQGVSYSSVISTDDMTAGTLTIAFDYVFVSEGEVLDTPVLVEILNTDGALVASSVCEVPCKAGYNTTVSSSFLTASYDNGGIGIDTDYSNEISIEVGIEEIKD